MWKRFEVEGSRLKGNGPGKRGRAKQRRLTTESAKYAETGLFCGSVYSLCIFCILWLIIRSPVQSPKPGGGTEGDIWQCGRYHAAILATRGSGNIGSDRLITGNTQVLTGKFFRRIDNGWQAAVRSGFQPLAVSLGPEPGALPRADVRPGLWPSRSKPGQGKSGLVQVNPTGSKRGAQVWRRPPGEGTGPTRSRREGC